MGWFAALNAAGKESGFFTKVLLVKLYIHRLYLIHVFQKCFYKDDWIDCRVVQEFVKKREYEKTNLSC